MAKNQKGFFEIVIILVIFVVVGIGGFIYIQNKNYSFEEINVGDINIKKNSQSKLQNNIEGILPNDSVLTIPDINSNLQFSKTSSLPDGQKLGIWNSDEIRVVYSNKLPADNTSVVNFTHFDRAIKQLNLSKEQKQQITEITKQAVSDLFVSYDDMDSQTDFLTKHFYVKDVQVIWEGGDYSENYTLDNSQLKLLVRYNFKYDWFEDLDEFLIIETSDGGGVSTQAQRLELDWFDFSNENFYKKSSPQIIPHYALKSQPEDFYHIFIKGFDNILSPEEAIKAADDFMPNRNKNLGRVNLRILDDQLYPSVGFSNSSYSKESACKGLEDKWTDVTFEISTCTLNLVDKSVRCSQYNPTCGLQGVIME